MTSLRGLLYKKIYKIFKLQFAESYFQCFLVFVHVREKENLFSFKSTVGESLNHKLT